MKAEDFLKIENITVGSSWYLNQSINAYANFQGNTLATQAGIGRKFKIIDLVQPEKSLSLKYSRIMVRLLEDGYECWLSIDEVLDNACKLDFWDPISLTTHQIKARVSKIILWLEDASKVPNKYLWGGTIGPDFDCSGLVQAAFSSQDIWLPRDAYQQEDFCDNVDFDFKSHSSLEKGDLFFFGNHEKATHVGVYLREGIYIHSSGISNGLNGIGFSSIYENDSISSYYRSIFRSIGRVSRCYDGSKLS